MLWLVFTEHPHAPNWDMHAVAVVASVVPVLVSMRWQAKGRFGHAFVALLCGLFVLRFAEDHVDHFPMLIRSLPSVFSAHYDYFAGA